MKSPTIRQLAQTEKPLVLPGAHDALSALLIKQAGFKGFFIESMLNEEEMARAVREVDALHVANMLEGGITPILRPPVLAQMGYKIALYGITLLLRVTRTMQVALADLKSGELKLVGTGTPFEEYTKIVGIERWRKIEQEFGQQSS